MAAYGMNPDERRRKQRALSNTGQRQTQGQYGMGFAPQYPTEASRPAPGYGGQTQQQYGGGGGYGMGFAPQQIDERQAGPGTTPYGGQVQRQWGGEQPEPAFSHQQLSGNYQPGMATRDTRHDVRMYQGKVVGGGGAPQGEMMSQRGSFQASPQRRYGQTQGFGQGYIAPRRSLGDQHRTTSQRIAGSAGRGYNPRTSANLYGGRPQGQARPQMNQMQAMTQNAQPASSYIKRPYGGSSAVTRQR